ncbi:hypothetical protein GW17_00032370 [Ensete ventricosum]|nr:hypothetical protein GW17_00032370 [Ensete ventricosum]RZS04966.1 hypothetical protein BHM03_00035382 [Ensete ventricosum]
MGIIHTRYNRPREGRTQERTVLFLRQSLTYIVITNIATFAAKIVGTSHGHHRSSRCRCGRGGGFPRAGGGAATGCGVSSSIGWASPPSPRHGCNLASSSLAAADALSFPIPSPTKKWLWLRVEEKGSEDLVGRETAGGGGGGGGTGEHRHHLAIGERTRNHYEDFSVGQYSPSQDLRSSRISQLRGGEPKQTLRVPCGLPEIRSKRTLLAWQAAIGFEHEEGQINQAAAAERARPPLQVRQIA